MTPDTPHGRHQKVGIVYDPRCPDCMVERPVVSTGPGMAVKTRRMRRSRQWKKLHGREDLNGSHLGRVVRVGAEVGEE